MNKKQHMKVDNLLLGYTIDEAHRFMDSLDALSKYGSNHRRLYHNWQFLKQIKQSFGNKAFYVAFLHLLVDLDIIMDRKELWKITKTINL